MKKIISSALCLMAMAITSLMFTSCGNDDEDNKVVSEEKTSTSTSTVVTLIVPQNPEAANYFDYQLTVKSDKSSSADLTKTISASDYKAYSSLSNTAQLATYLASQTLPSDTKYYETTATLPDSYTKFTVDLKAVAKTGTAQIEKVTCVKGYIVSYQLSSGSTNAQSNKVGAFSSLSYDKFQELLDNSKLDMSTEWSR